MAKKMTARQERFVHWYVRTRNASEAARQAGYHPDHAGKRGWDLLNDSKYQHVRAEVDRLIADRRAREEEEHELLRQVLISRLTLDPRRLYKEDGTLKNISELDEDDARHIQTIQTSEFETEGQQKGQSQSVKLNSLHEAAKQLAQSNGFTEQKVKLDIDATYLKAEQSLDSLLGSLVAGAETEALLKSDTDPETDP